MLPVDVHSLLNDSLRTEQAPESHIFRHFTIFLLKCKYHLHGNTLYKKQLTNNKLYREAPGAQQK